MQFLVCTWNHEHIGSLAFSKLTLQETGCVHVFHDSMNRPKIEFITNIYIHYKYLIYKKII